MNNVLCHGRVAEGVATHRVLPFLLEGEALRDVHHYPPPAPRGPLDPGKKP
ncbi:hypothetical protein AWB71_06082 [Caballeronia peredens]|nr:hypothetical protein AWB71_06082 [Caballeronia peredens]